MVTAVSDKPAAKQTAKKSTAKKAATTDTKARKRKPRNPKRALQLSLGNTKQMYFKLLAILLFNDVSSMVRDLIEPYAQSEVIKDFLAEHDIINPELSDTFDVLEEELPNAIEDIPLELRVQLVENLIAYGKKNGLDYERIIDIDKLQASIAEVKREKALDAKAS